MNIINYNTKQKFTTISFIILLFLVNQIYGQGWQTTFPDENGACNSSSAVASSIDGGYVIFYDYINDTTANREVKVRKIDADGNMVWSKRYRGLNADYFAADIKACSDGGFILAGRSDLLTSVDRSFSSKIDAAGNHVWWINSVTTNQNLSYERVEETLDNGYLFTSQNRLTKQNNQGGWEWTKTFTSQLLQLNDLTINPDSSTMVIANAFTGHNELMKLDQFGNLIWSKTIPVFGPSYINNKLLVAIDKTNNGYIMGGFIQSDNVFLLVETDWDGNKIWEDTISSGSTVDLHDIRTTPDQGFIIAGSDLNGSSIAIKTNALGQVEWRKEIPNNRSAFHRVDLTQDGGFVFSRIKETSTFITPIQKTYSDSTVTVDFEITHLPDWCTPNSETDGSVTATPLNIPLPHSFEWSYGSSLGPTAAVEPGWNYVTITDGNSMAYAAEVYIPMPIKAELVKMDSAGNIHSNYIYGNILNDQNDDCLIDLGDTPLNNWMVHLTGDYENYTFSDTLGNYSFELDSGSYNISTILPNALFAPCVPFYPINFDNYDSLHLDIPIKSIVDCPIMTVDIGLYGLKKCLDETVNVYFCNEGTVDATDVYIEVTLDTAFTFVSCPVPWTNLGGNTYSFDIGDVPYNSCDYFSINTTLTCYTQVGQTHCIEAHIFPDSLCVPPSPIWDGSITDLEVTCAPDSITFTITNVGQGGMSNNEGYIIVEDNVILKTDQFQLTPSDDLMLKVPSNGSTYRMYAGQAAGYFPIDYVPTIAIEGCGTNASSTFSLGFVNAFENTSNLDYLTIKCFEVKGPFDPNDKSAVPAGFGSEHFIEQNTDLDYHIRFQNIGNDTAFNVVIRDTLSEHLNMATIKPGASSHPYQLDIIGNNILKFSFPNIELVDSTTNEPDSHGFIQFNIEQHENLPIGTMIYNSAAIYFDFELPVITNQTYHEIGEQFIEFLTIINAPIEYPDLNVKIYPNPFSTYTDIVVEHASYQTKTFSVIDLMGRTLSTTSFDGNHLRLQRKDLPSGAYFFTIKENQNILSTGRFIVH